MGTALCARRNSVTPGLVTDVDAAEAETSDFGGNVLPEDEILAGTFLDPVAAKDRGDEYQKNEQYSKALAHYQRALKLLQSSNDPPKDFEQDLFAAWLQAKDLA